MTQSVKMLALCARGLRKFAAQVTVSVVATVCATGLYGHFVTHADSHATPQHDTVSVSARVDGGVIDARTLAYYPEHLAVLDSLSQFRPVSTQRTAELAGDLGGTRSAGAYSDAAKRTQLAQAGVLHALRPVSVAQVNVLPPRRPTVAPEPAPLTLTEIAPEATPERAKILGLELPRFVPTGAVVIDKLASVKDRIGGLMHVSSR